MSATRGWSKWTPSMKRGFPMFVKESFINKPELAIPLVGFPLVLVGYFCRYYYRNTDIDDAHKYKYQYTIVRYEDVKDPDKPYLN